jgi:acetyl esterase
MLDQHPHIRRQQRMARKKNIRPKVSRSVPTHVQDMIGMESLVHARVLRNIKYGNHKFQKLDLYRLDNEKKTPLVYWFHGGGFNRGDKDRITRLDPVLLMLKAGFSVAIPNYRLARHAPYPAAMQDGARAVQFGKYSADEWNFDPDKVAVAGSSAGGMIALWVAFHDELADKGSADPVSRMSTRVRAVAGYNTQSTIVPGALQELVGYNRPVLLDFFGLTAEECDTPVAHTLYEQASAITHATRDSPPVFLCYNSEMLPVDSELSDTDKIHHPVFGKYLKDRLDALGVECECYHFEGGPVPVSIEGLFVKMVEFLQRHLNGN